MGIVARLSGILKPEHLEAGMNLLEDEDYVELYQDGCLKAVFGSHTTAGQMRAEADKWL